MAGSANQCPPHDVRVSSLRPLSNLCWCVEDNFQAVHGPFVDDPSPCAPSSMGANLPQHSMLEGGTDNLARGHNTL